MDYKLSDPYLTVPSEWGYGDIQNPANRTVIVTDVSRHVFNHHAKLDGYFNIGANHGKLWWEDGMQDEIVHVVHILTDDIDSIYCGYCIMNDARYFTLLGRLKDGHPFTEACRNKLKEFTL